MTILLCEGFENIAAIRDIYDFSNETSITFNTIIARSAGGTSVVLGSSNSELVLPIPLKTVFYLGFGFYQSKIPTSIISFIDFSDGTQAQCILKLLSDGTLGIYRSTIQLGVTTVTLDKDTWYYIEVKITIADSLAAGDIEVKIDGTSVLTINSGDSKVSSNFTCSRVVFHGITTYSYYIDDVYISDSGFLGQIYVKTLTPTGTDVANFVGSDADSIDNHLLVDDTAKTTYVEAGTAGDIDQYTFPAMPAGTVHAVAVTAIVKNSSGGDSVGVKPSISPDYTGSTQYVGLGYSPIEEIFEVDPATSAQWLKAGVDATNFGLKVA